MPDPKELERLARKAWPGSVDVDVGYAECADYIHDCIEAGAAKGASEGR